MWMMAAAVRPALVALLLHGFRARLSREALSPTTLAVPAWLPTRSLKKHPASFF